LNILILNLPEWEVTQIDEDEDDYVITARPSSSLSICPFCGYDTLYKHGDLEQHIRDVPSHGKRVLIQVTRQRYRCKHCTKTSFETLPDIDEKRFCTKRLITFLQRRSMNDDRTFLSLAEETGLHEKTVRRIFHDYVLELERSTHFATPRIMGMDELHVIHQPRAIITNIERNTVVEFLADRKKQTIIRYLSSVPDREHIALVCIDMWQPYREAVREVLPHAIIVIDKFHAVKLANQAMEVVRKEVRASLTEKQRRTLIHDRFLLLKRESELKEKERLTLEAWTGSFPTLKKAYDLKEAFYEIWDAPDKDEAHQRYFAWQEQITPEVTSAFTPIALTVEEWGDEIFAYFDHRITNAYTESLNGLARVANRLGRGYSFQVLRARLLYGIGQHRRRKAKVSNVESDSEGVALSTLEQSVLDSGLETKNTVEAE